ncbi:hypothetical protein SAMN02910353_03064 [Ruminococcus sp. YRD2003]|uniref:hypothetical protein n=1 Tax=Ruminococcus sp. YRD2003 TaxID=1452313 RepID=UPI0008C63093|nr:hypothetical protein SAMN02910353_03064 [Ruminococcus flavefaciens]
MKVTKLIKAIPTASPATEALKLASFLVATLLVGKLEKALKETAKEYQPPYIYRSNAMEGSKEE